jgi:hypothetical protein
MLHVFLSISQVAQFVLHQVLLLHFSQVAQFVLHQAIATAQVIAVSFGITQIS